MKKKEKICIAVIHQSPNRVIKHIILNDGTEHTMKKRTIG